MQFAGQKAVQVGTGGGLANDVFQSTTVIVTYEEVDRFIVPLGLRGQASQPPVEQSGMGADSIQQRQPRLHGNGPEVAGVAGQIDSDKASRHDQPTKADSPYMDEKGDRVDTQPLDYQPISFRLGWQPRAARFWRVVMCPFSLPSYRLGATTTLYMQKVPPFIRSNSSSAAICFERLPLSVTTPGGKSLANSVKIPFNVDGLVSLRVTL